MPYLDGSLKGHSDLMTDYQGNAPLDIRPCLRPYIALGLVFGFLFIGSIWQATVPGGDWRLIIVAGVALVLAMMWLGTMRIQHSGDGQLSYRTLFTGTRCISISDIESAETKLVSGSRGSRRFLFIYSVPGAGQKSLKINLALFSRGDLSQLFDLLGPKLKGPRIIGVYTDKTA